MGGNGLVTGTVEIIKKREKEGRSKKIGNPEKYSILQQGNNTHNQQEDSPKKKKNIQHDYLS